MRISRFAESLPGTGRHQALLRAIIEVYEHDERVLAIGVLGSIARGTWDEWSDLDLDIVTTGDIDAVAHPPSWRTCGTCHPNTAGRS